jgi:hypothetical protein
MNRKSKNLPRRHGAGIAEIAEIGKDKTLPLMTRMTLICANLAITQKSRLAAGNLLNVER